MRKIFAIIVSCLMISGASYADLLAGWNVATLAGTNNNLSPVSLAPGVDSGNISRGAGLTPAGATNSFSSTAWTIGGSVATAIANNDYFSIIVNAGSGNSLTLTNIAWQVNRSGTGPTNFTLRSSIDSFAADITTWNHPAAAAGQEQSSLSISGVNTIEFRIYGFNAGGAAGSARIFDGGNVEGTGSGIDLGIFGTVVPEPATFMLMGVGLVTLTASRRRIRRLS